MPERPLVSIIIPTLNEEEILPTTLKNLDEQPGPVEVIVADGQSTDATAARAQAAGASVVEAPRGRGIQMNCGAKHTTADFLLFLHADTRLPPDGLSRVRSALTVSGTEAGIFRLQFDASSPLLRFYEWCTTWPWIRLCFGDRGLFMTRSAFEAVGGFPEWPLFEDLELAARLQVHGGFRFLDAAVTTSARRFQKHGHLRQQLRNLYLWSHYVAGSDPKQLAHLYHYDDEQSAGETLSSCTSPDAD